MDKSLIDYILQQGLGVVFGAICFWLLIKEKRKAEQRLVDVIRERKTDRDELLKLLGRIDAHLSLRESLDPDVPKRRDTDRALIETLEHALDRAKGALSPSPR